MKNEITILISVALITFGCGISDNTAPKKSLAAPNHSNSETSVEGEWERTGVGTDENENGLLDVGEIKPKGSMPSGFDYFRFYGNGKCIFDKDIKFDGTFVIKPDEYGKKAIFIYGDGMPAGLSQKEKDGAAYVFRIRSVDEKKMLLAPAHLQGTLVLYKRL